MHFVTLMKFELEPQAPDKKTDAEILGKIEELKQAAEDKDSWLRNFHVERLTSYLTPFSRAVSRRVDDLMEHYNQNTEDPAYLEFDDRTDELTEKYEQSCEAYRCALERYNLDVEEYYAKAVVDAENEVENAKIQMEQCNNIDSQIQAITEQPCPENAIKVENNLASVDYTKCTGCRECFNSCITNCIKAVDFYEGTIG